MWSDVAGYRPGDAVLRSVVSAQDDEAGGWEAATEAVPGERAVADDKEHGANGGEAWAACEGQRGHQGEHEDVGDYGDFQFSGEQRPQADQVAAGEDGE